MRTTARGRSLPFRPGGAVRRIPVLALFAGELLLGCGRFVGEAPSVGGDSVATAIPCRDVPLEWEVRGIADAFDEYGALAFRTPYGGVVECSIQPPRRWYQFRLDRHPPEKHLATLLHGTEYPPFVLWRVKGESVTYLRCLVPGHENKETIFDIRGVRELDDLLEIAAMRLALADLTLRRSNQGPDRWTPLSEWGP